MPVIIFFVQIKFGYRHFFLTKIFYTPIKILSLNANGYFSETIFLKNMGF